MFLSSAGFHSHAVPIEEWQPATGAMFLVDTKEAKGYVVNPDGAYAEVPVVLGQNSTVHYLGRTYKATTPEAAWVVKSVMTQGDRITFGHDGTFMRLFRDGSDYTSYGIHTHANIERMLESDNHFRSMGCILVRKEVLDKLQQAYEQNGKSLQVVTVYGMGDEVL